MSMRVLADPVAKERILQFRSVLDSGFIDAIQRLLASGDDLVQPCYWDGPKAKEFQGIWPGLRQSLLDAHRDLSELAGSIDQITTQIMIAGGRMIRAVVVDDSVAEILEEAEQVVGVLLLDGEDRLHQPAGGRILVAEPADDLAVGLDGDPLGDEVLPDHVAERVALDVLGVAA